MIINGRTERTEQDKTKKSLYILWQAGWHLIVLGFISGDGPVMVTILNRKRRLTILKQGVSKG